MRLFVPLSEAEKTARRLERNAKQLARYHAMNGEEKAELNRKRYEKIREKKPPARKAKTSPPPTPPPPSVIASKTTFPHHRTKDEFAEMRRFGLGILAKMLKTDLEAALLHARKLVQECENWISAMDANPFAASQQKHEAAIQSSYCDFRKALLGSVVLSTRKRVLGCLPSHFDVEE